MTLLVASPLREDLAALRAILANSNWTIYAARSRAHALRILETMPVSVILSERDLPDGNWKDLLREASRLWSSPELIVASRSADERLWCEALRLGAYDVLAEPFQAAELCRVLESAWCGWAARYEAEYERDLRACCTD